MHLCIKAFFATSENAVKTQIWIAVSVCAGGHRPQTLATGVQPLPNPTDTERYAFRENANITGTSGNRLPIRFIRLQQPTDSV